MVARARGARIPEAVGVGDIILAVAEAIIQTHRRNAYSWGCTATIQGSNAAQGWNVIRVSALNITKPAL